MVDKLEEFLGDAEHFELADGSTVDITEASAAHNAMKAEIARLREERDDLYDLADRSRIAANDYVAEIASLRAELAAAKAYGERLLAGAHDAGKKYDRVAKEMREENDALRAELASIKDDWLYQQQETILRERDDLRAELAKWQEIATRVGFDGLDTAIAWGEDVKRLRAAARQDAERVEAAFAERDSYMASNTKLVERIRQDAEEKARLTGLLERWMRHADIGDLWRDAAGHYLGETMVAQDTRAALACTPTGMPSGVQQAQENARLWQALAEAVPYIEGAFIRNGSPSAERALTKARAALAVRPQRSDEWTVAVRDDELLVEVPGLVIVTFSDDGFGYAIRDGDRFVAGHFDKWSEAFVEINAALACRPQGEPK